MKPWKRLLCKMDIGSRRSDSKRKKKKKSINIEDAQLVQEGEEGGLGRAARESNSLSPLRKIGGSKIGTNLQTKARRRVQWNDKLGNKLEQIREFVPSDSSDDDYDYDEIDTCKAKQNVVRKLATADLGMLPLEERSETSQ